MISTKAAIPNNAKTRTPSPELAAIIGSDPIRFSHALKSIWKHIRANGLQSQRDGRRIRCDAVLRALTGKDEVGSFDIPRFLSSNLK